MISLGGLLWCDFLDVLIFCLVFVWLQLGLRVGV